VEDVVPVGKVRRIPNQTIPERSHSHSDWNCNLLH